MSSLRVRAQNKLLNKLGAAKPSKNVQFDHAHANFEKTHSSVASLEAALSGFIVSLKGFHVSAQVLYGAIEAMGSTPESSPDMKETVAELKNAFVHVDVAALEDSVKRFENRVLRPANGWMGRAATLKTHVAEFHEEKLAFDHYTRKVMALRESRDKRSAAGKNEKSKDVEKLVRNEQKLAATTNAYSKLSDKTVASLRDFTNTREATLVPIVQRVIEFRLEYANRIADESRVFQKMVRHDSAFDNVLGALESFAAQVGNGAAQQCEQNATSAGPTREPDVPVHALSFECFVGEASQPPPATAATTTAGHAPNEWVPPAMLPVPAPLQLDTSSGRGFATALPPPPPAGMMPSPSSSSSTDPFFDTGFTPPSTTSFQTAPPVQPMSPSSPTSGSFTPWDDIPPPPPMPQDKTAFGSSPMHFNTMPVSPTAPPTTFGWDCFDGMADFQKTHHQSAIP